MGNPVFDGDSYYLLVEIDESLERLAERISDPEVRFEIDEIAARVSKLLCEAEVEF